MSMPGNDAMEWWWANSAFSYIENLHRRRAAMEVEEHRLLGLLAEAQAALERAEAFMSEHAVLPGRGDHAASFAWREVRRVLAAEVARLELELDHVRKWAL